MSLKKFFILFYLFFIPFQLYATTYVIEASDTNTNNFTKTNGYWYSQNHSALGIYYDFIITFADNSETQSALWRKSTSFSTGKYEVFVSIPHLSSSYDPTGSADNYQNNFYPTQNATYEIYDGTNYKGSKKISHYVSTTKWISLGEYTFNNYPQIKLSDRTNSTEQSQKKSIIFSAIKLESVTTPINGVCGSANGETFAYNVTNYSGFTSCSVGSQSGFSFPSQGSSDNWTCIGTDGGSNASCSASRDSAPIVDSPINGQCGDANGRVYGVDNFNYGIYQQCSYGSSNNISYPNLGETKSWTCIGSNGGTNSSCSTSRDANPENTNNNITLKTCSIVDNNEPWNCLVEQNTFEVTDTVHAWADLRDLTEGTHHLEFIFTNNEKNVIEKFEKTFNAINNNWYRYYYYISNKQSGNWKIQIYLNGVKVKESLFTINSISNEFPKLDNVSGNVDSNGNLTVSFSPSDSENGTMGANIYLSHANNIGSYQFASKKNYSPSNFTGVTTRTISYTKNELENLGITNGKIFKIRVNLFDDYTNETIGYSNSISYNIKKSSNPVIAIDGLPDCVTYTNQQCLTTNTNVTLKFNISDIDNDFTNFRFSLGDSKETTYTENINAGNSVITKDVSYSSDDLNPCQEFEKYNGTCHKKYITITAATYNDGETQYTSEQFKKTFLLYDYSLSRKANNALEQEKIEQQIDSEQEKYNNINNEYLDVEKIYEETCLKTYSSKYDNVIWKLIEDDYRRIVNNSKIYNDSNEENTFSGIGNINDKHPYVIKVTFGKEHNYPAKVEIDYNIIGYPLENGEHRHKDAIAYNYTHKEYLKSAFIHQIIADNFDEGICLNISNTSQMFSSASSVEELALQIENYNQLDHGLYPAGFFQVAQDIANGTEAKVAKEIIFDTFATLDVDTSVFLMLRENRLTQLYFEFINEEDYLSQYEKDIRWSFYHFTKWNEEEDYHFPNKLYYLSLLKTEYDKKFAKVIINLAIDLFIDTIALGGVEKVEAFTYAKTTINAGKKLTDIARNVKNTKSKTTRILNKTIMGSRLKGVSDLARNGIKKHKDWANHAIYDRIHGKTHEHEFSIDIPDVKRSELPYRIPDTQKSFRLDAIKFDKKNNQIIIRELKPNNKNAENKGKRQLENSKVIIEYLARSGKIPPKSGFAPDDFKTAEIILGKVDTYD